MQLEQFIYKVRDIEQGMYQHKSVLKYLMNEMKEVKDAVKEMNKKEMMGKGEIGEGLSNEVSQIKTLMQNEVVLLKKKEYEHEEEKRIVKEELQS